MNDTYSTVTIAPKRQLLLLIPHPFQGAINGALLLGYSFCTLPGVIVNVTSVQLSGFVLVGLCVNALLSIFLPSALILYPHAASIITFFQGLYHSVTASIVARIMVNWIPDKENTFLSSLYQTAFLTGRLGVMFLSAPIAQHIDWSGPYVIFGSTHLFVIALLSMVVS